MDENKQPTDNIDSSELAKWLLSGVALASTATAFVGLSTTTAPRLINTNWQWFAGGFGCILAAIFITAIAFAFKRTWLFALAAFVLVTGIAVLVALQMRTSIKQDVPVISLNIIEVTDTTVEVEAKISGAGLEPGQYLLINIVGVPDATSPVGESLYRSPMGADTSGGVSTAVSSVIARDSYAVIEAEVYLGPGADPVGRLEQLERTSTLCSAISEGVARSCAFARVP